MDNQRTPIPQKTEGESMLQPIYDPTSGNVQVPVAPELPVAPNLADTYDQLSDEYGIDTLEQEMNTLKAQQMDEEARGMARMQAQEGKAVSLGVIGGRQTEIERQEQVQLDFIGRQLSRTTDQLNSAYKAVDMIMQFTQSDFTNAMAVATESFSQSMAMYDRLKAAEIDERDFEQRLIERDQDMARANLQIYADLVVSGSTTWAGFPPEQQEQIHKLEVQSGLGFGFMSKLQMPPGANIKSITTRTDQSGMQWADTLYVNPDGSLRVESTQIGQTYVAPKSSGSSGSSSSSKTYKEAESTYDKFQSSLMSPSKTVVATSAERKKLDEKGKSYFTREQFISQLQALYPQIAPEDIAQMVYTTYPDH